MTLWKRIASFTMSSISERLYTVNQRINTAFQLVENSEKTHFPSLIAVSKTKPIDDIIEAYNCGQREFGENYVNELIEKANDAAILDKCPDINWHFIGTLQSNKVNKICKEVRRLAMVQTVGSEKLASLLDSARGKLVPEKKLDIMIQVGAIF